jgi:hypothetical protein
MIPRPVLAAALLALVSALAAPAAAQDAVQDSAPDAAGQAVQVAPEAAGCTVRDTTGMITLVICPEGLGMDALRAAGEAACDGRELCLAWIWDDPEVVPDEAPETSEGLGGEALAAARAVWVQYDRQLISMEEPYVGIGDEDMNEDLDIDAPLLPPVD